MRRVLAASLLCAFATAAQADGPYKWTGFYLGAHAGYGWGEHEGTGVYTDSGGAYKVLDPEVGTIDMEGAIGGGQLGFNVQSGRFVYGVEGDFSWSGINGRNLFISDAGDNGSTDYTWDIETSIDWLATLRGRVGFLASPTFLVYGTGGVAFAGLESSETVVGFPPQGLNHETTVRARSSENAVGWVLGAGAEWLLAPHWTVKAEWQYLQFDDVDSHFKGTAYPERVMPTTGYDQDSFPGELGIHTVRVGVNYRFGGN